ncbi:MAG: hypothetical protein AAGC47_13695 [Bacteroidota bacterium]
MSRLLKVVSFELAVDVDDESPTYYVGYKLHGHSTNYGSFYSYQRFMALAAVFNSKGVLYFDEATGEFINEY